MGERKPLLSLLQVALARSRRVKAAPSAACVLTQSTTLIVEDEVCRRLPSGALHTYTRKTHALSVESGAVGTDRSTGFPPPLRYENPLSLRSLSGARVPTCRERTRTTRTRLSYYVVVSGGIGRACIPPSSPRRVHYDDDDSVC